MLDKLESIKVRFDEVSELLVQPDVMSDMKRYIQLNKEYKDLEPIISAYKQYKNILSNIDSSKEMLKDEEMREMAKLELDELQLAFAPCDASHHVGLLCLPYMPYVRLMLFHIVVVYPPCVSRCLPHRVRQVSFVHSRGGALCVYFGITS